MWIERDGIGDSIMWIHEKFNLNVNVFRSKPRAFTRHGSANPGSPHGDKDRGSIVDTGGSGRLICLYEPICDFV